MSPSGPILERNVELLLRRSYVPARPSPEFRDRLSRRWRAAVREHARSGLYRAGRRPALGWGLAAAAAALVLAVRLLAPAGEQLARPPLGALLARGEVAVRTAPGAPFRALEAAEVARGWAPAGPWAELHAPAGAEARLLVPGGEARAHGAAHLVARLDATAPTLELRSGALELESAGAVLRLATDDGALELERGVLAARLGDGTELELARGGSARMIGGAEEALPPEIPARLVAGRLVLPPALELAGPELARPDLAGPSPGSRTAVDEPGPESAAPTGEVHPGRARLAGTVVPPEGAENDGFRVHLLVEQDYASLTEPLTREFEGTGGELVWEDVEPGLYDVFVDAPGCATWRSDGRLELRADATTDLGEVRLERGVTLAGHVYSRGVGTPVPGALVVSESDVPTMALPLGVADELERFDATWTRADAAGAFELTRLAGRPQLLRVSAPGHAPAWVGPLEPGEAPSDLLVELGPEARVKGRVHDADGRPWAEAIVVAAVVDQTGTRTCLSYGYGLTDGQGHYAIGGLPAGFVVIVLVGDEGGDTPPEIKPTTLELGDVRTVDFGEARDLGTRLTGRVLDANGAPVPLLPISIAPAEDEGDWSFDGWRASSTTRTGEYRFLELAPGPYDVFLSQEMGAGVVRLARVDVPDLPELSTDLRLAGGRVTGIARAAEDGSPEPRATVLLWRRAENGAGRDFHGKTLTDERGRFELGYLAPGRYELDVFPTERALAPAPGIELELTVDEPSREVEARLEPGARLTVRAVDESGAPLDGARVELVDAAGGEAVTYLEDPRTRDGACTLPPLAPGPVRVRASLPGRRAAARDLVLEPGEREVVLLLERD